VSPVLALVSGILLGLAFPKFGMGWLAAFALVPLLVAIHPPGSRPEAARTPRRAFRLGYLTGFAFFLILLHWIPRLPRENVTIPYAMIPALFLVCAYLALYPALAAAVSAWLARRGVPIALSFPAAWTLLEALRGTGIFGFPWGSLGYALAPFPHVIQFASVTGLWGVTLWLVAINGVVHAYLGMDWSRGKAWLTGGLFLLLAAPYLHGRAVLGGAEPATAIRVGMVQPNIGKNKWDRAVRDSLVEVLLVQTELLVRESFGEEPDLILWPETAIPARLPREPVVRFRVESMIDTLGIPLLAGFPDGEPLAEDSYRFTNSAALVLPEEGMVGRYDKRHLVPFSEHFPFPLLQRYDFGQSNFSRGEDPGYFDQIGVPFGVLICFESIFPGQARELTNMGARFLVNITNDQWFGDSAAPSQHFYMNVLRAVENGVGIARAANTGISGIIDSHGFVRDRSGTFVQQRLVAAVPLGEGDTVYRRFGNWVLWLCGAVLAACLARGVAARGRA